MSGAPVRSARALGLCGCHVCGLVMRAPQPDEVVACPRCGTVQHLRKPQALSRCWALLIAAMMLYIPANVLPIMRTGTLFGREDNTILSGVVELWHAGSWDLALIVFVASIMVPMLKFLAMMVLLVSTQRHSAWSTAHRARLYRVVELVGYWSMLDVFVVTLLVSLVHFQPLTEVDPRPGVVYFGMVVVLTMLAAMSFDPRLMWDNDPLHADPSMDSTEEDAS